MSEIIYHGFGFRGIVIKRLHFARGQPVYFHGKRLSVQTVPDMDRGLPGMLHPGLSPGILNFCSVCDHKLQILSIDNA